MDRKLANARWSASWSLILHLITQWGMLRCWSLNFHLLTLSLFTRWSTTLSFVVHYIIRRDIQPLDLIVAKPLAFNGRYAKLLLCYTVLSSGLDLLGLQLCQLSYVHWIICLAIVFFIISSHGLCLLWLTYLTLLYNAAGLIQWSSGEYLGNLGRLFSVNLDTDQTLTLHP